ncbi:porin [Caballeronia sp. LZ035]|uniref:porin n=1 Tax=Caballeronia sp. LZ035 TaxID=3038568 RepID=UPI0028621AD6|nr:porin [Caballeronia sp. LZ035]MDR5760594.1 porin [Caballeronia sp. LZ035]
MPCRIKSWVTASILLGFNASVQAQSSITLYGVVDVDVDVSNQGHGTLVALQGGGMNSSEFGFKGIEDLGGGLKAVFDVENGFSATTGAALQNGALFGRQAWVGMASRWGTLTVGRQYSPEYVANTANDAFTHGLAGGLSNIGNTINGKTAGLLTVYSATGRTDNSINYVSPTLAGVTLRAMYGVGGVPGSISTGSTVGIGGSASWGPVGLSAGYTRNRPAGTSGVLQAFSTGGSVQFGQARVIAAITKDLNSATPGKTTRFTLENLGMQYQVSVTNRLLAQVIRLVDTSDGLPTSRVGYIAAIGLFHSLSKRTSVYCDYAQVWNKEGSAYSLGGAIYTGAAAVPNAIGRTFQVGVQTLF